MLSWSMYKETDILNCHKCDTDKSYEIPKIRLIIQWCVSSVLTLKSIPFKIHSTNQMRYFINGLPIRKMDFKSGWNRANLHIHNTQVKYAIKWQLNKLGSLTFLDCWTFLLRKLLSCFVSEQSVFKVKQLKSIKLIL